MSDLWQTARECAEAWDLTLEAPLKDSYSLVIPAGEVVLKVNADWHFEAEFEAAALDLWAGRAAVRLIARDDERRALLLERCTPGTRLEDSGADEIEVVAELLPRLSIVAEGPHPFRLLADEAERWTRELPERHQPGRLLDAALDVFRSV